tara:strand:+ start:38 stop:568 length:531 start_codon:yes stop_codon:yes gene_type:complete
MYTNKFIFFNESVNNILNKVIRDDSISIEKFRQVCLISGAIPQHFFIIQNRRAIAIDDKNSLYLKIVNQNTPSFFNLFHSKKRSSSKLKIRGGKVSIKALEAELRKKAIDILGLPTVIRREADIRKNNKTEEGKENIPEDLRKVTDAEKKRAFLNKENKNWENESSYRDSQKELKL